MADHSFNAKSLLSKLLKGVVNMFLFTTADDNMCPFLTKPFSNCETNAVSKDIDNIQFT